MKQLKLWATLDPFYESGSIMGRTVINALILDALLNLDPFDEYHFFMRSPKARKDQLSTLEKLHPDLFSQDKFKVRTFQELPKCLGENAYHVFHLSDCIIHPASMAWLRNVYSEKIFPITGLTHTLSMSAFMIDFLKQLWPGTTERDVIVSSSRAGIRVVENYFDLLFQGFGLDETKMHRPQTELIPLGIDTQLFCPLEEGCRTTLRESLEIPRDAVVLLVFARISHSSKMDILPLFRALQRLFLRGLKHKDFFLVIGGFVDKEKNLAEILAALAHNMGLPFKIFDSPPENLKRDIFACTDVFVSIPDNVQETFGITIVEAMSMGLPVIASDFDGYRDIVVPEETGLLVPTAWGGSSEDLDVLGPILFDNFTHLALAQRCIVSVPDLAASLECLLLNPDLRRSMGTAARKRAVAHFDIHLIAKKYLELWDELWNRPINVDREALRKLRHPLAIPYGQVFSHYPSESIDETTLLTWSRTGKAVYHGQDYPIIYDGLSWIVKAEDVRKVLFLSREPLPLGKLVERLAPLIADSFPKQTSKIAARNIVAWALKQDMLEIVR